MSQAAALPDVIRDFERTPADIVRQAGEFASSILADVAGRRGALHGRIAPLRAVDALRRHRRSRWRCAPATT